MLFGSSHCVAVIDLLVSLFGLEVRSYGFLNQLVIKPPERRKTNRLYRRKTDFSDSGASITVKNNFASNYMKLK